MDNPQCDTTEESKSPTAAAQLGMNNLGGVFVFLIGGLALALLIALIEFLINAFVNSKADKVSYLLSHSDSTTPLFVLVFVIFHGIIHYDAYHEKKEVQ